MAKDTCGKALELGQNLTSVHVTLGMIYTDAGRNDLATQELEQAQNLDATNPEVYAAQADLYHVASCSFVCACGSPVACMPQGNRDGVSARRAR